MISRERPRLQHSPASGYEPEAMHMYDVNSNTPSVASNQIATQTGV